ncbi:MAG: hypothetical protein J6A69_12660 [Clostridia bacterium]|nr:hypothetical protein [Clostridia bacterium]
MKKIIILLLCCGVLMGMVGCGGNTALPPTESPPTTIAETPTETTPPTTEVEPTEKEKEHLSAESKDQATEPPATATEPTTTATEKPNEEIKPTAPTKPKEEKPTNAEEPQEEIYVGIEWPEVDPADIERLVIEKINAYRIAQDDAAATVLPGLTRVARHRANELTTNFEHRAEQHVSTELQYGQFVDLGQYGMSENSYYKGYSREAIGMGDWFGTAESLSDRITDGFHHSKGHWSYVGSSKYPYISIGITKANGKWYVCVLMREENYGG